MLMFRTTHDAIVGALRERIADLAADRDRLLAHLDRALTPPPAPAASAPVAAGAIKADPVVEAITARAGNNGPMRTILGAYVKQARAEGKSDAHIAARVRDWSLTDEMAEQAAVSQRDRDRAEAEQALAMQLDGGVPEGL